MRVALVIPTLDESGAEKQLALLAAGLPARGVTPHVFALDRGGVYEEELRALGVDVTVIQKRGKIDRGALQRLREGIHSFDPQVVHSWLFAAHAYGWAASRSGDAKWFQSLRCVDTWKGVWQRLVDKRLWPRVDRFVANGEAVAKFYADAGVPQDRLIVVPNAVQTPDLPSDVSELRADHNIGPSQKIVLTVGRLAPQKRVKDLLWAFQLLRQSVPGTVFVIAGDGPLKTELKEYAASVECAADVRFVGHVDPRPWLAAADVFWLGSGFEGQSNAVMEAMAVGLPCVATAIDPNRELITHDHEGYLPNVGDAMAFAQYTTRLLQSPDTAKQLGDAAAARMATDFGVAPMIDAYVSLYHSAVS